MDRNSQIRASNRSSHGNFQRQNSIRYPSTEDNLHRQNSMRYPRDEEYTPRQHPIKSPDSDLDPDVEGEKFYASVQRLIDHFQYLDTERQKQVNDELEYVVPGFNDRQASFRLNPSLNRDGAQSRSFRRSGVDSGRITNTPKFVSASDLPSYVDGAYNGGEEEYQETAYFRRGVPSRQTVEGDASHSQNTGGYFGVRLSQRKPTHRDVSTNGDAHNDYDMSPSFKRTLSLDRHDRYIPMNAVHPKRHYTSYDSDTAMMNTGPLSDASSVEYVSDTGALYAPPKPTGRHKPRRSTIQSNARQYPKDDIEKNPIIAALRERYPAKDYRVTQVSSSVTSPDSTQNGGFFRDDVKRKMIHHQPKRYMDEERPHPKPKGLLKKNKKGESHVDVIDDVNQSSTSINNADEPHILTNNGRKYLQLTVDVGGFKPKDIQIITQGKLLQVIAKGTVLKKTDSPTGATRVYRELKRQFALPEMVSAEHLQGVLNEGGVLLIEGPLGFGDTSRKRKSKRVKFVLD